LLTLFVRVGYAAAYLSTLMLICHL